MRSPAPSVLHACVAAAPTAPRASAPGAATLIAPTSGHPCPALCTLNARGDRKEAGLAAVSGQEPEPGPPRRALGPGVGGGAAAAAECSCPERSQAVAAASPRDPGGRKRKCRPGALARRESLRCCPAAPCTSHGLLHGELEPARGLCLLPVSRPALPPTHGLAYPAVPPALVGAEPAARDPVTRRWGPPLAGSPPASATERTKLRPA